VSAPSSALAKYYERRHIHKLEKKARKTGERKGLISVGSEEGKDSPLPTGREKEDPFGKRWRENSQLPRDRVLEKRKGDLSGGEGLTRGGKSFVIRVERNPSDPVPDE